MRTFPRKRIFMKNKTIARTRRREPRRKEEYTEGQKTRLIERSVNLSNRLKTKRYSRMVSARSVGYYIHAVNVFREGSRNFWEGKTVLTEDYLVFVENQIVVFLRQGRRV